MIDNRQVSRTAPTSLKAYPRSGTWITCVPAWPNFFFFGSCQSRKVRALFFGQKSITPKAKKKKKETLKRAKETWLVYTHSRRIAGTHVLFILTGLVPRKRARFGVSLSPSLCLFSLLFPLSSNGCTNRS